MNHRSLIAVTTVCVIFAFGMGGYILPAWPTSGDPNPEPDLCDLSGNCFHEVTVNGTSYSLGYSIFGETYGDPEGVKLVDITSNPGLKALEVDIVATVNGTFRIELPRHVTNEMGFGRDIDFVVLADGQQIERDVADSDELTILFFRFEKGTEQLMIGDSRTIPEFGNLAIAVFAAVAVSVVVIARSDSIKSRWHRRYGFDHALGFF